MASIALTDVEVHFLLSQTKSKGLLTSIKSLDLGGAFSTAHGKSGVSALRNINLTIEDGDKLAIIGHNGAGKSTLLRVLATILPPTSGRVRIEGTISALMSIHLGLDPLASGYDNIRSRARYMGRTEKEIEERFREIADFTELGDYLELPLKSYSSGMKLRLTFAIATAFQPEVLVLDEWLSAGDRNFRDKATARLDKLIQATGIVVIASHNNDLLARICNRGLVLRRGEIVFDGSVEEAIEFGKTVSVVKEAS
ncbi:MAG: ABC transporter ATP-binding protein [Pseudomonadota bacterium]